MRWDGGVVDDRGGGDGGIFFFFLMVPCFVFGEGCLLGEGCRT